MRLVRFAEELLPPDGRAVPQRWQSLARDWTQFESEDPEGWSLLKEEIEGLESEVRRTKREPRLRRLGRLWVQIAWGVPAWICRRIGRAGRPSPDKLVTVQLLAATALMPIWALATFITAWWAAGPVAALGAALFLALGAYLAPRCASRYRARPAGAVAEALGARLAQRLQARAGEASH